MEKKAFELYQSEMLRATVNNIAGALGGTTFPKSWKELQDYKPETRTPEEIKSKIINGLRKLGETE